MRSPDAFDETTSPFLLEVLETLGTEAQEASREDERAPGTEGGSTVCRNRRTTSMQTR